MNDVWKIFWDLLATGVAIFVGVKVFLWSGDTFSAFGYFPIGVIVGGVIGYFSTWVVYAFEGIILWLLGYHSEY